MMQGNSSDSTRHRQPPYIRQEAIKEQKPAFMEMFGDFYCGTADIYTYFYKTGLNLLKNGAILCYIAPNKFMRAGYGRNTRILLTTLKLLRCRCLILVTCRSLKKLRHHQRVALLRAGAREGCKLLPENRRQPA